MSDCIFCKIARGEIPSTKLFENEEMLAFKDIDPKAPLHFLVIPKKHIDSLMDMDQADSDLLGRMLFAAQDIAKRQGCEEKGARFVLNCKSDGGQSVGHLHLHVLGGRALKWPPG